MDDLQQFLAVLKTLPAKLPLEQPAIIAPKTEPTYREKIQKLNQDITEGIRRLPDALQQELATVGDPSNQPLDTRRTPVPHPSNNASDAFPDATGQATASAEPRESTEARFERERAEYLAQLLRESTAGKSPIDDLTPERQQALYELILQNPCTVVVKMIAAPEPIGWNFKTCDTSLRRFKQRYEKQLATAERMAAIKEARGFLATTDADEQSYMDAARRLLKIRLYKNAADPKGSDEKVELIMGLLDRQRRTDLAERRVKVAERRSSQ